MSVKNMQTTDDEMTKAEQQSQRRRLEAEMFSLESDRSRLKRQEEDVLIDIKKTKNDMAHLKVSLEQKEAARVSLERNITLTEAEISRVKKKMSAL